MVAGKPRPFGMELWLSEIERTSMYVDPTLSFVLYENLNRNYSNLVRYNTYGIGCAGRFCTNAMDQFNIFCLTNKPPLREYETIYYTGAGPCPTGDCQPDHLLSCDQQTGLCIKKQS
ncbi:hypothetical protein ANCCAN_08058 [Ancylostoma caninum]|uniref:SCP domain-containing protein n=1 Tax=Ancylostoma caninum TaxID=29170 RepID=A0A368GNE6_ANCCA|nr:hypothetical protein ANCCAN_08058 [Ancylostoma caninum]